MICHNISISFWPQFVLHFVTSSSLYLVIFINFSCQPTSGHRGASSFKHPTYCTTSNLIHTKTLFWDCDSVQSFKKCAHCELGQGLSRYTENYYHSLHIFPVPNPLWRKKRDCYRLRQQVREEKNSLSWYLSFHVFTGKVTNKQNKIWHHIQIIRKCCFTIIMIFIEVMQHWPCFRST